MTINYDSIAHNLHQRDLKAQQQLVERIEAARIEIDRLLANFLEIDPTLQKVVLFGSLARQTVRSPAFDIDLAVQGSPDKFLLLVAAALDSDFTVDVVDLTCASPNLSQFIVQDGIVLYEKCRNAENTQS